MYNKEIVGPAVADKKGSHWVCTEGAILLECSAPLPQVQKANLVDSRTSVNDVKFAPQHLGLMLVRS